MSSNSTDPANRSPAAIEEDVERARATVSDTLDALRGKLAPGQIVEELVDGMADFARGSGGASFARNLGGAVRDNPLPVLLIGAGLGWLMLANGGAGQGTPARRDSSSRFYPYGEEQPSGTSEAVEKTSGAAGEVASSVGAAVGDAASRVGDAASRLGSYVEDAASRVADAGSKLINGAKESGASVTDGAAAAGRSAASTTREAWSSASGLLENQPLLVGLLGVAVGAALGAALPRTQTEDELLGEAADAATARVREFASGTAEQLRAAAGEHLDHATHAASEGYAKVKEHLGQGSASGAVAAVGEALSTSGEAAAKAAGHAAEAVKDRLGEGERQPEGGTRAGVDPI
ncbi:MAG: DUF3618 domain-containing protein [Roseococcus sp.]|nr:DUF3618 domain-containing protein [Roseococcus sp.]